MPFAQTTVVVPATSANLGPGFDALGLALDLADEVSARITDGGLRVDVTGEGAGEVPTGEEHLIIATMLTTFAALGVARPAGLALTCHNRIPHARGLGSSSAAIVAGILLARALASECDPIRPEASESQLSGNRLDDNAGVLRLAAAIEGHPDNVAPCLLGGFTIAWTDPAPEVGARAVSVRPARGVHPVIFVPQTRGLTAHARAALPASVPHRDAAFNAARSALLVHALTQEPGLLLAATEDRLHQDYRAASMPETAALVGRLRAAGVAAVVSGAGPSVLALCLGEAPDPPSGWCRGHSRSAWTGRVS